MQYALLIYASSDTADRAGRPIPGVIADVLARPSVTGWVRLHADESATTVRGGEGRTLLTDGPFVESKEFLGGEGGNPAHDYLGGTPFLEIRDEVLHGDPAGR